MDVDSLQPVGSRFHKLARCTLLVFAATAVAGFALTLRFALQAETEKSLIEQAGAFAAGLAPQADGDLTDSVDRIQEQSDRLVALAVMSSGGRIDRVYPDRPAHRLLITEALANQERRLLVPSPIGENTLEVFGVLVPLQSLGSPDARQILVILKVTSAGTEWLTATALFTCLSFLAAVAAVQTLVRWFDRRVVRPLREMAESAADPAVFSEGFVLDPRGAWRETAQIAARFDELVKSLADADARTRRLERDSQRQIKRREIGFDRELRRAKDRVYLDSLTGLKNRMFLEEQLDAVFESHRLEDTDLCAVMMDLDNFKTYNDALGHQVGDALLRFVGALLRGSVRPVDHAIRYGGDEFLLLLPGADARQAAVVSERVVKLFGQYARRLGRVNAVSMSAGIASWRENDCNEGRTLIAQADAALYVAKRGGKNAIQVHQKASRPCEAPTPLG